MKLKSHFSKLQFQIMETLVDFTDCQSGQVDSKYTSRESLAHLVGCCVSSVQRNIDELERSGMLTVQRKPGTHSRILMNLDLMHSYGLVPYKRTRESGQRVGCDSVYDQIEKML